MKTWLLSLASKPISFVPKPVDKNKVNFVGVNSVAHILQFIIFDLENVTENGGNFVGESK